MHTLFLNIFSNHFKVVTNSPDILQRITLDFHHFSTSAPVEQLSEQIHIMLGPPPWEILPPTRPNKRTDTSIIYEKNGVRYNDYHGKALTTVDTPCKQAFIYAEDLHLAHELGYLLLLSKSGKKMDLSGLHKIHAMGIQLNHQNVIFVAPSGGGKSTLFLELLNDEHIRIYSDDTPVINSHGHLLPFPLRIGLEANASLPSFINVNATYRLRRRKFGEKLLVPLNSINRELAQFSPDQRILLLKGKRLSSGPPKLIKISRWRLIPELFQFMVIGIGLPMILEYFLESGFSDILRRVIIILKRSKSAACLLMNSETYLFELSPNKENNAHILTEVLSKKN